MTSVIQRLRPTYQALQELIRDLRTIEDQGWTDAAGGGAGITVGHGAPTATGADGELYINVDSGDLYEWT